MGREITAQESEAERAVDAKRRADNCMVDIKNALQKWQCKIEPMMQIGPGNEIRTSFAVSPLMMVPLG